EQRRSAMGAEAALHVLGAAPDGGRAARPDQGVHRRGDQRGEDVAHRLLAHAAMADMGVVEHGGGVVAHGAALAAAADFYIYAVHSSSSSFGGQSAVSWSGCWLEWMPAMKFPQSLPPSSRQGNSCRCSTKPSLSWGLTWTWGATESGWS